MEVKTVTDNSNGREVKTCPMTQNKELCSGESCEWFVKTKRLAGRGLCAVTLFGLGAFLLEDIASNTNIT